MFPIISRRTVALLVTLFAVAVASGALALRTSYQAGLDLQARMLQTFVRSQALTVEGIADASASPGGLPVELAGVMPALASHVERFEGFATTGDFRLARLVDGHIEFLNLQRTNPTPSDIELPSDRAAGLQRALRGESGLQVGLDHDGELVLAAFEPVPALGLGLVAQVDMAEVRAPYLRAAAFSGLGSVVLIALGFLVTTAVSTSTEREREGALMDLSARKELLHAILEHSPVLYVTFDGSGDLTYMNRAFRDTYGWSEEDWSERDVLAEIFPDPDFRAEVLRFMSEASGTWADAVGRNRAGEQVTTRYANYRLPDGTQVVIGLDVSALKRAEAAEHASFRRLERAEEIAGLGSWSLTLPEMERSWSKNMYRLLGFQPGGELPDLTTLPHLHPDDREIVQKWLAKPPPAGVLVRERFRTHPREGLVRHFEATGSAEWSDDGRPVRLEGTVQEVTEHVESDAKIRAQQEALLAEERRFRHALDHMPDIVVLCDVERKILFVNEAALEAIGGGARDLVGGSGEDVLPEDMYAAYLPIIDRAIETGEVHESSATVRLGSEERFMDIVCVPLLGADGSVREVVCIAHDLTDRYRAEREVRDLAESLEDTVEQRTLELVGANAELESFSYTVSHDLKAPLRAIDGFSALLMEGHGHEMSDDARRLVAVIRESVQRMGHLVDGLLDFSRLGRRSLAVEPIDMHRLVSGLVADAARTSEDRCITFSVGQLPTIQGDATMIRQVFENLIANAIKFTRDRPQATIEIGCRLEGGEQVFFVSDNGAGFDATYKDKLFKVFERLHYADEFPGTGVGLAIVKRVVEKHGGSVSATGAVDEGATITVALPA